MGNGSIQADASRRKAPQLKELGFTHCVDEKSGQACAGAGKVTPHAQASKRTITCGNQEGRNLHICETRNCTRRSVHRE